MRVHPNPNRRQPAPWALLLLVLALACHYPGLGSPEATAPVTPTAASGEEPPPPAALSSPMPEPSPEGMGTLGPFVPVEPQPPAAMVQEVHAGPEGALWLVAAEGLLALQGGEWVLHPYPGGLLLGFDGAGRTWMTPDGGTTVAAWDGVTWRSYGEEEGWTQATLVHRQGLYASAGEAMVTDRRGAVWLVTWRDLRVFDAGSWRVLAPTEVGFDPSPVMEEEGFGFILRDVALDAMGDVWVTDCAWIGPGPMGQGARWFDGTSWHGERSTVVGSGCVEDVEVDAAGRIWLGVDGVLWRYTIGTGWEELVHPEPVLPEGLRWGWISRLEVDNAGTAWVTVALCGGASCDPERVLLYSVTDQGWAQVGDAGPFSVAVDGPGSAWVCDGAGLSRVEDGARTAVAPALERGCRVESGPSGQVWLVQPGLPGVWQVAAASP
jgi:hypothetical protein